MLALSSPSALARTVAAPAKLALLGSGTVGMAVLQRLSGWSNQPIGSQLRLVYAANTRTALSNLEGLDLAHCAAALAAANAAGEPKGSEEILRALGSSGVRIVIDATADGAVAASHPALLEAGVHVATACKLACGTSLALWRNIRAASDRHGARFGDRATVGAGLPLLGSIRQLRAGGDRIHAIAGVMSGSLAWLFNRFDGSLPFSELVREAHAKGYTEPDPRDDLSGEDVRRKLLILARAGGFEIESESVAVHSLVPPTLAALGQQDALVRLALLDDAMAHRLAESRRIGGSLRFVARLDGAGARVGLEVLGADDALGGGRGTDNRVAIWSDRYHDQPLIIQGPGAGAQVTAAALLDDVLRLARAGATTNDWS